MTVLLNCTICLKSLLPSIFMINQKTLFSFFFFCSLCFIETSCSGCNIITETYCQLISNVIHQLLLHLWGWMRESRLVRTKQEVKFVFFCFNLWESYEDELYHFYKLLRLIFKINLAYFPYRFFYSGDISF